MTTKDELLDRLLKETDPWEPYTGPYGGDGWLNARTGEVRYQEEKPSASEGSGDEQEQYGPAPDAGELGDDVDSVDDYGPVDWDLVHDGDPVVVDFGSTGALVAEFAGRDSETGTATIRNAEGNELELEAADILGAPAQPPPEGFADGWQPPGGGLKSVEEGQTVELYDTERGEYVLAEQRHAGTSDTGWAADFDVTETDEWSPGEDSDYQAGQTFTVFDQGRFAVTAEEDPDYSEYEVDDTDYIGSAADDLYFADGIEEGEDVLLDVSELNIPGVDGDVIEAEVDYSTPGNTEFTFESNGKTRKLRTEVHDDFEVYDKPTQFMEPAEVPGLDMEDPAGGYWSLLDGEEVQVADHPMVDDPGEVTIEHVAQDGEYDWLHLQTDTDPENLEPGDPVEVDGLEGDYTYVGPETAEHAAETHPKKDDPEDIPDSLVDERHILEDEQGEERTVEEAGITTPSVPVTSNPDHPYTVSDALGGVEDPWTPVGDVDEIKPGDRVVIGEEATKVNTVAPDGSLSIEQDGEQSWVDPIDVDRIDPQEDILPPATHEWESSVSVTDSGEVAFDLLNSGDTVYYHDPEAGEMTTGTVDMVTESEEVPLENGETITRDQMQGYADTGMPELPSAATAYDSVAPGEEVTVTHVDPDGNGLSQTSGIVVGMGQDVMSDLELYHPETEEYSALPVNQFTEDAAVISDVTENPEYDLQSDWESESADTIADRITSEVNVLGAVNRDRFVGKLMEHYPPSGVSTLHWNLGDGNDNMGPEAPWKNESGSLAAARYETMMKEGIGIDKPTRKHANPNEEAIAVAEGVHEVSKQRFKQQQDDMDNLHRGLSDPGAAGLLSRYIADPFGTDTDSYKPSYLAINNFTTHRSAAESLGGDSAQTTVVSYDSSELDPEAIAAYHDELFTGPNDSEGEISLRGDVTPGVEPDKIDWTGIGTVNFGKEPHEWDEEEARGVEAILDYYGKDVLSKHNVHGDISLRQAENVVRMKRAIEEQHDLATYGNPVFERAEEALREKHGVDPEAVEYPELEEELGTAEGPEALPGQATSITDLQAGMEVEFSDQGEIMPGEIVDVMPERGTNGEVRISNANTGKEANFDASEITEISYASDPFGEPAEGLGERSAEEFGQAEQVMAWTYGGNWEEVMVLGREGSEVEVSRETGMTDYYEADRLAHPNDFATDDAADGSDAGEDVGIPFEQGDVVDHPDWLSEVTVEAVNEEEGTVEVVDGSGFDYEQPLEQFMNTLGDDPASKIESPDTGTTPGWVEDVTEVTENADHSNGYDSDAHAEVFDMLPFGLNDEVPTEGAEEWTLINMTLDGPDGDMFQVRNEATGEYSWVDLQTVAGKMP